MDASVLLLPELGLIDAHDPRFASTVAAIEQDLVRGRHVMRYAAEDDFGLPETEFLVCRFWLIDALCALGRREEARERFRMRCPCAISYGLLAEDIHPQTGALWGNFPQTYSMAGRDPQRHAAQPKLGGPLLARIFIISNRVAVPRAGSHPGGLEVVLKATLKKPSLRLAGLERARSARRPRTKTTIAGGNAYIVTDLKPEDFDEYYNGFANRVLWPILHYRLDLAEFSRRDLSGYLRVNDHFADELAKVLQPDDIVWVHDYHLIPLAKALRARGLTNRIGFFLHIPLPPPEILTAMPNHETLIPSLGDYDLVGFQTDGDAANFARYLAKELGTPSHISRRWERATAPCASAPFRWGSRRAISPAWRAAR